MPAVPLFGSILGFFTGNHKMWAWGAVALVLFGGFAWWSVTTIKSLKRENETITLRMDNKRLVAENKERAEEAKEVSEKMNAISASISRLSERYGRNAITRQTDFDGMTGPVTQRPDGTVDTAPLQEKANSGMNKLFSDLTTLSREGLK